MLEPLEVAVLLSVSPVFLVDAIVAAFEAAELDAERTVVAHYLAAELFARTSDYRSTLDRLFGEL